MPDAGAVCPYNQIVCEGNVAKVCDGQGGFSSTMACLSECKDGLGCVKCIPNAASCAAATGTVCDATGTIVSSFACDGPGMTCDADGCHGECSPVSLGMGYQGCDFLPTVTSNSVWTDRAQVNSVPAGFHFGILIGNVSPTADVTVKISGPTPDVTYTIMPGESKKVQLDWVQDLKGPDWDVPYQPGSPTQSVKKANGAYRVVSNRPIVVYQFNAYENEIPDVRGCPAISGESAHCYAYSGDGSLLLPVHALASNYTVTGYHAYHKDFATLPGSTLGRLNMGDFLSIAAPQANTDVTIKLRPNQTILSGPDIPRVSPDNSVTITLAERQVLQLFTPGLTDADTFSGTEISTKDDKPVQVLSGVGCVNILDEDSPCGHIEDSVLPRDTLGKDYVVPMLSAGTGTGTDAGGPIAHVIRLHAVTDGTAITSEPKQFTSLTLNKGESTEFSATTDVRLSSTTPFGVTQYWAGRAMNSRLSEGGAASQLSVIPIAQFRTTYAFVASPEYTSNFVTIIAPTGAAVSLDGQPVAPEKFVAVGASGTSVARVPVVGGQRVHNLTADKPVGVVVFGVGPYGSYAFPGGLDLKRQAQVVR